MTLDYTRTYFLRTSSGPNTCTSSVCKLLLGVQYKLIVERWNVHIITRPNKCFRKRKLLCKACAKPCIAIDDGGGQDGDVWFIEPAVVPKARQFAINVKRDKHARDHGLPLPVPGEAPSRCPTPRYADSGTGGYLFLPTTHENGNHPPELIESIVLYALRDVSGYCYDRVAALCSSSRRMHEVCYQPPVYYPFVLPFHHWCSSLLLHFGEVSCCSSFVH